MHSVVSQSTSGSGADLTLRDSSESVLDRAFRSLTSGLLGTLYVLNKQQSTPWLITVLATAINFLQMLAFPLSSAPSFPWARAAVWRPVLGFLDGISVFRLFVQFATTGFHAIAFFSVLSYLAVILACAVASGHSFSRRRFRALWPLKFLRLSSRLNVALFIPVISTIFSPFVCVNGATLGGAVQCSGAFYAFLLTVVSVIAVLFATLTMLVTLVYYDGDPKSSSAFSRAHARADVVKLFAELVLTIFFSLAVRPNPWAGVILVFGGGALWLGSILYYLPFFSIRTNAVFASMAASFLWACFALLVAVGVGGADGGADGDGGVASASAYLFLAGVPVAAAAGGAAAVLRLYLLLSSAESGLQPLATEIRTRMALTPAVMRALAATGDSSAAPTVARVNRELLLAVSRNKDSSMLEVAFARFLRHYRHKRSLELIHLSAAERKNPALDERFTVYQRRNMMEEEEMSGGSSTGKVTLLTRVAAERHDMESRRASTRTKAAHVEFWKSLAAEHVDTSQLAQIGLLIANSTEAAQRHYGALLKINRASPSALRSYARFLLECVNDAARAESLLAEAEQLENTAAAATAHKMHAEREVYFMSPATNAVLEETKSLGVLNLATDLEASTGSVTSANAAALRMLGLTEQDLVGRTAGVVMPQPLSGAWSQLARSFLLNGSPEFVDTCRFVLLSHSSTVLLPALAHVRPLGTRFALLMEPVRPVHAFLLYSAQDRRVLACCRKSTDLLGLEVDELGPGSRHYIDAIVVDFPRALGRAHPPPGLSSAEEDDEDDELGADDRMSADAHSSAGDATGERPISVVSPSTGVKLQGLACHFRFRAGQCNVGVVQWRPEVGSLESMRTPSAAAVSKGKLGTDLSADVPDVFSGYEGTPRGNPERGGAKRFPRTVEVRTAGSARSGGDALRVAADAQAGTAAGGLRPPAAEELAGSSSDADSTAGAPELGMESDAADAEVNSENGESRIGAQERKMEGARSGFGSPPRSRLRLPHLSHIVNHAARSIDSTRAARVPQSGTPARLATRVEGVGGVAVDRFGDGEAKVGRATLDPVYPGPETAVPDGDAAEDRRRIAFGESGAAQAGGGIEADGQCGNEEEDDPFREARTHGSRSSMSSTLTMRLRRTMSSVGGKMEPSLLSLLLTLRNLLLLCVLLTIVTISVEAELMRSYLSSLRAIQASAEAREAVLSACIATQNLVLLDSGEPLARAAAIASRNASLATLAAAASTVEHSLRELQVISRDEYGLAQVMGGRLETMWSIRSDGSLRSESMTFFSSMTRALADMRYLIGTAANAQAGAYGGNVHAMFILANTPRGVDRLCAVVTAEMARIAYLGRRAINTVDFCLFCLCITLIDALALGFVLPVIRRVYASKEKILQSFFDVPQQVANELYKTALAQLHSMLAEDGDADFEDLNELDSEILAADGQRTGKDGGGADDGPNVQHTPAMGDGKRRKRRRRVETSASRTGGLLLVLKFGVPIVGVVGFFLLYASLRYNKDDQLLGSERMLGTAAEQNVQAKRLVYHARAASFPALGPASAIPPTANTTLEIHQLRALMIATNDAITFGSARLGMPSVADLTADLATLYLEDMCSVIAEQASCRTFSNALLDSGLHEVIVRMEREAEGVGSTAANGTLPTLQLIYRASEYVFEATYYAQVLIERHVVREMESGLTVHIIAVVLFIASCLLIYAAYYRPAVQAIDKELKRTRAMLLIVPEEILRTLNSVRELLQDVRAAPTSHRSRRPPLTRVPNLARQMAQQLSASLTA